MRPLIVAESRASYLARSPLVVDASVIATAIFAEARHEEAHAAMRGHVLLAPDVVDLEIANAAVQKIRRGMVDIDAARGALADFAALELARHAVPRDEAFELAIECGLSAYDAAYLWLALAGNAPLATFDERLGTAARDRLGRGGGAD